MKTHIANISIITSPRPGSRGRDVLLGHKKPETEEDRLRARRKVGCGKWVMVGGGEEPEDLSLVHGAQREALDETGLGFPPESFRKIAVLEGYFGAGATVPTFIVHIYAVEAPASMRDQIRFDTEEYDDMRWFDVEHMPWEDMIPSDRRWLPQLLAGEQLDIKVVLSEQGDQFISCEARPARYS